MSVPFYVAVQNDDEVQQIDASIGYRDGMSRTGAGGTAYAGSVFSQPVIPFVQGGEGKLGNVVQSVESGSAADVKITPVADDVDKDTQAITVSHQPTSEDEKEYPFYVQGKQIALRIEISNFNTEVELGSALVWMIPTRLHR